MRHWIAPRPSDAFEWVPTWVDGPPSIAEQLAFGINAPAEFASVLVLIPFNSLFHNGASHELAAHTTAAFFIPVLWYFIGIRVERRIGAPTRPTTVGTVLAITGLAVAVIVAILVGGSFVVRFDEMVASRLCMLAWAIFGALASSRSILRWRTRATS